MLPLRTLCPTTHALTYLSYSRFAVFLCMVAIPIQYITTYEGINNAAKDIAGGDPGIVYSVSTVLPLLMCPPSQAL
jgi:hypothetical protein